LYSEYVSPTFALIYITSRVTCIIGSNGLFGIYDKVTVYVDCSLGYKNNGTDDDGKDNLVIHTRKCDGFRNISLFLVKLNFAIFGTDREGLGGS
jgi:hypothetical protein